MILFPERENQKLLRFLQTSDVRLLKQANDIPSFMKENIWCLEIFGFYSLTMKIFQHYDHEMMKRNLFDAASKMNSNRKFFLWNFLLL